MVSTLKGAELAFSVDRIDIPLAELEARFGGGGDGGALAPPEIAPPVVDAETLELAPIRDLAVRELISHARSGQATIHLPLRAVERKVGPLKVSIAEGSVAVIELLVKDGRIVREATRGSIVPAVSLPLGLSFRGLYLDDTGAIWADIENFPDLNLSFLALDRIRVPGSMDEVLNLIFPDDDGDHDEADARSETGAVAPGESDGEGKPADAIEENPRALARREEATEEGEAERSRSSENPHVDIARLAVEARDVVPRPEPFHLGHAGFVEVGGEETRLDVDYSQDHLAVRGRVDLTGAQLGGAAFKLEGMRGLGTVSIVLDGLETLKGLELAFEGHHGAIDLVDVELPDGTEFRVESAALEGLKATFTKTGETQAFRVAARKVAGRFAGGAVMLGVGQTPVRVELGAFSAEGALDLSDQHYSLDLLVEGATLRMQKLSLNLGIAEVFLEEVEATADGTLKAGTDFGFSFSGTLKVRAKVGSGEVAVGPVGAGIGPGTEFDVVIEALAGGPEGVDALLASGTVRMHLRSGSLPLGEKARLEFSRGATGAIHLDRVELEPGARWPRVSARAALRAQADAVVVQGVFEIPAGTAQVEAPRISLDEKGHLVLEELRAWLSSDVEGIKA